MPLSDEDTKIAEEQSAPRRSVADQHKLLQAYADGIAQRRWCVGEAVKLFAGANLPGAMPDQVAKAAMTLATNMFQFINEGRHADNSSDDRGAAGRDSGGSR